MDEFEGKDGAILGSLLLEPIVMGAGGMIFVDPLFQRVLVQVSNARVIHAVGELTAVILIPFLGAGFPLISIASQDGIWFSISRGLLSSFTKKCCE